MGGPPRFDDIFVSWFPHPESDSDLEAFALAWKSFLSHFLWSGPLPNKTVCERVDEEVTAHMAQSKSHGRKIYAKPGPNSNHRRVIRELRWQDRVGTDWGKRMFLTSVRMLSVKGYQDINAKDFLGSRYVSQPTIPFFVDFKILLNTNSNVYCHHTTPGMVTSQQFTTF